jgi:drug/metabolite transporter (DMT)-like permease
MLLGLIGLGIVFSHAVTVGPRAALGIAGILLAVHLHAASSVWVKRIGAEVPALETTTGALLVAVPLFLLVWALLDGQWPAVLPVRAAWSIAYLGVLGSAVGFVLYYYVLRHLEASRVALITLITPVLALLVGQYANSEVIDRRELAGIVVILSGLAAYQWGDRVGGRRARA